MGESREKALEWAARGAWSILRNVGMWQLGMLCSGWRWAVVGFDDLSGSFPTSVILWSENVKSLRVPSRCSTLLFGAQACMCSHFIHVVGSSFLKQEAQVCLVCLLLAAGERTPGNGLEHFESEGRPCCCSSLLMLIACSTEDKPHHGLFCNRWFTGKAEGSHTEELSWNMTGSDQNLLDLASRQQIRSDWPL